MPLYQPDKPSALLATSTGNARRGVTLNSHAQKALEHMSTSIEALLVVMHLLSANRKRHHLASKESKLSSLSSSP